MAAIFLDYYGVLVYVATLLLWIAPIKSMVNLYKSNDVWQVPYNFYMLSMINCLFWIIYGLQINIWPIWAVNIPGFLSFFCCMELYLFFHKMKRYELVFMIIALPLKACFIFFIFYNYVDSNINGYITMIANIFMYTAPVESIYHVVVAKNNIYIELWLALAVFLNTSVYFIYGLLLKDNWDIIIPNGIGFFVSIAQLIVWYKYRATTDYETIQKTDSVDSVEVVERENELNDLNEINTSI